MKRDLREQLHLISTCLVDMDTKNYFPRKWSPDTFFVVFLAEVDFNKHKENYSNCHTDFDVRSDVILISIFSLKWRLGMLVTGILFIQLFF